MNEFCKMINQIQDIPPCFINASQPANPNSEIRGRRPQIADDVTPITLLKRHRAIIKCGLNIIAKSPKMQISIF